MHRLHDRLAEQTPAHLRAFLLELSERLATESVRDRGHSGLCLGPSEEMELERTAKTAKTGLCDQRGFCKQTRGRPLRAVSRQCRRAHPRPAAHRRMPTAVEGDHGVSRQGPRQFPSFFSFSFIFFSFITFVFVVCSSVRALAEHHNCWWPISEQSAVICWLATASGAKARGDALT
jgi:hypothetical protein